MIKPFHENALTVFGLSNNTHLCKQVVALINNNRDWYYKRKANNEGIFILQK